MKYSFPSPLLRAARTSRILRRQLRRIFILVILLPMTGCVTAGKYRMSKSPTTPVPLGWKADSPEASLALQALIVFKERGSWKKEARWDEYVVALTNRSDRPMTIDSAQLIDLMGAPQLPGSDPWQLEKLSYSNWDKYGKSGLNVLVGAGAVTAYAGAVTASASGSLLAGSGTVAGGAVLFDVIPAVAIAEITTVAVMNHNNKAKVQAEFQRRRLVLPLTIPAGESVQGSLFFPMTPGPQRLVVAGRVGDAPVDVELGLQELAGLHLKKGSN